MEFVDQIHDILFANNSGLVDINPAIEILAVHEFSVDSLLRTRMIEEFKRFFDRYHEKICDRKDQLINLSSVFVDVDLYRNEYNKICYLLKSR